jgi:hypothetical protein
LTAKDISIVDGRGGPSLPIVDGVGECRAIIWPGIGARSRSLHRLWLNGEAATVELNHPSDAVYYVVDGAGWVIDRARGRRSALRPGAMFHVDRGTPYVIQARVPGMQVVGGPAPADDALYAHLSDHD